jgi:ABC-type phosphate/phosphonate transport system substrate-binding protein
MKKALTVCFVLIVALLAAGCGSAPAAAPQPVSDPNIPPWINDQPPEDLLWGVGISSASNAQLRMTAADANARADIARQLKTIAETMVTTYQREAGGLNATAALGFEESINRQVAQANLQGASRDQYWVTPDGKTGYARVAMSKADLSKSLAADLNKAVETEASRYAEFKADEALKLMDAELNKYKSDPSSIR